MEERGQDRGEDSKSCSVPEVWFDRLATKYRPSRLTVEAGHTAIWPVKGASWEGDLHCSWRAMWRIHVRHTKLTRKI